MSRFIRWFVKPRRVRTKRFLAVTDLQSLQFLKQCVADCKLSNEILMDEHCLDYSFSQHCHSNIKQCNTLLQLISDELEGKKAISHEDQMSFPEKFPFTTNPLS